MTRNLISKHSHLILAMHECSHHRSAASHLLWSLRLVARDKEMTWTEVGHAKQHDRSHCYVEAAPQRLFIHMRSAVVCWISCLASECQWSLPVSAEQITPLVMPARRCDSTASYIFFMRIASYNRTAKSCVLSFA